MNWIKVEDALPENTNEVLLFCGDDIVQGFLKNGVWYGSSLVTDNMNDGYVADRKICKQGGTFDFVTHWMPLPEKP